MPKDELLRLSGSVGNPKETVVATHNGAPVFLGKNRMVRAELRVAGAVSGTNPTLDVKFQQSDTATGAFTDVGAAFAQATASDFLKDRQGTMPQRIAFSPTKDWVRVVFTLGGTASPTFTDVSVVLEPLPASGAVEAYGAA